MIIGSNKHRRRYGFIHANRNYQRRLIVGARLLRTTITTFFDVASIMIVLGGTFASTFISFSDKSIMMALKDMVTRLFKHQIIYTKTIKDLIKLAKISRMKGRVALEKVKVDNKFMQKGLVLVASGVRPEIVQRTMSIEKKAIRDRELQSQAILEKMGDLSPAWGMVGTLIGLVIMMLKLDDPSKIGPAMAIALLTTFYGAVLANLLFNPCTTKIEQRSTKSLQHHDIIIEGILSIANGENPSMIKDKLMGFLVAGDSEAESKKTSTSVPHSKGIKKSAAYGGEGCLK